MWRQGVRSRLYETDDADPAPAALGSASSRATPTASPCRATPPTAAARGDGGARSTNTRPLPRLPIAAASRTAGARARGVYGGAPWSGAFSSPRPARAAGTCGSACAAAPAPSAAAAPTPPIPVSPSRECHRRASALEAAALVEASEGEGKGEGEARLARTPVPPAGSSRRSYGGAAAAAPAAGAAPAHRPHWCG